MSLTSHGSSRSSSTVPLPSTMQTAQDRSDTSIPAKYSISHLPCSQSSCDLIGSSTPQQRAAQLRMLWAVHVTSVYLQVGRKPDFCCNCRKITTIVKADIEKSSKIRRQEKVAWKTLST